jgi:hypothetical protein
LGAVDASYSRQKCSVVVLTFARCAGPTSADRRDGGEHHVGRAHGPRASDAYSVLRDSASDVGRFCYFSELVSVLCQSSVNRSLAQCALLLLMRRWQLAAKTRMPKRVCHEGLLNDE